MRRISTCLHRFLPSTSIKYTPKGCGDCSVCIQDERNEECSRYTPISVSVIDIERSRCFFSNSHKT